MTQLWISAGLVTEGNQSPEEVKQALSVLREATIKEPGCIQFDVLQHQTSPEYFTLWEGWLNKEALDAHYLAAHTRAYFEKNLTSVSYIEQLDHLTSDAISVEEIHREDT